MYATYGWIKMNIYRLNILIRILLLYISEPVVKCVLKFAVFYVRIKEKVKSQ